MQIDITYAYKYKFGLMFSILNGGGGGGGWRFAVFPSINCTIFTN